MLVNSIFSFPTMFFILPNTKILGKKPFENIVGKGENAGNQHVHLLPQCFSTLPNTNIIVKKPFENIVGKGENAGFPTMFSSLPNTNINFSVTLILSSASFFNLDQSKNVHQLSLCTTQSRFLSIQGKNPFENIAGKGENAGHQHFLLFPQCFLPFPIQITIFQSHLFCRLQVLSSWTSLQICRLS